MGMPDRPTPPLEAQRDGIRMLLVLSPSTSLLTVLTMIEADIVKRDLSSVMADPELLTDQMDNDQH
jgi:hypothetical protein